MEEKKPEILYHYTSLTGFREIVTTKKIWASNILYLNDSQEIKGAIEAIWFYIESIIRKSPKKHTSLLKEMMDTIEYADRELGGIGIYDSNYQDIFVCSFSSEPDMLNQWRGYCPESQGVCIGFGFTEEVIQWISQNRLSLFHCDYYSNNKYPKIIKEFIRNLLNNFDLMTTTAISEKIESVISEFNKQLIFIATRLKHSAFKDENEWRLVSAPIMSDDSRINYRVGKSMLIPYIEIDLVPKSQKELNIPIVWIGPTPNFDLSKHSVKNFLEKNRTFAFEYQEAMLGLSPYDDLKNINKVSRTGTIVETSKVPYRTW